MAEVNTDKGKSDGKKGSKQKNKYPCRLYADGGYEYVTDYVLHALYFTQQAANDGD